MDANNNVFYYRSCRQLHRLYAHNQLELERQLQLHRAAATLHGFQYCENSAEENYHRLPRMWCRLNNMGRMNLLNQGNA
jgi:hypothetical protein